MDDFNYASLHDRVEPLALTLTPMPLFDGLGDIGYEVAPQPKVLFRLKRGRVAEGLEKIETAWKEAAPGLLFTYTFLDDAIGQQYRQEERLTAVVQLATALVLLIACLGLFGLAKLFG